jgi:hypothetical protein
VASDSGVSIFACNRAGAIASALFVEGAISRV